MGVDGITNDVLYNSTTNNVVKRDVLDKNAFLRILAVQLSNQDPMNAKDNTEYIAQMAQFSALEQSQNLNVSIEKLLISQKITEGSMLVGKEVAFLIGDNNYVKETVKGMIIENSNVYLKTSRGIYNINDVIGVGEIENDK